jgi:glycosyltransferase involved in cell wall biosynthesis
VLSRLTGAHCVVHVHVGYNPDWMGRVLRWSLHHAGTLVAISAFVGATLTEAGIDRRRVVVVPNGIDVEQWRPDADGAGARRALGIGPDTPLLLSVCRLFPAKGPADAVEAVARLRGQFPDVRLLIVGLDVTGGSFSAELRARVAELGLEEHVSFLGRRDDVQALMAACDVYVMPSHLEPFGLVFCEAMAMRRPVVGLADGGTVEVVEDGRTGLLSQHGDLDGLVRNLEILLADPALRATMGEAGRRVVEARFTTQRMADGVESVYRAITCTLPGGSGAHGNNEGDQG